MKWARWKNIFFSFELFLHFSNQQYVFLQVKMLNCPYVKKGVWSPPRINWYKNHLLSSTSEDGDGAFVARLEKHTGQVILWASCYLDASFWGLSACFWLWRLHVWFCRFGVWSSMHTHQIYLLRVLMKESFAFGIWQNLQSLTCSHLLRYVLFYVFNLMHNTEMLLRVHWQDICLIHATY